MSCTKAQSVDEILERSRRLHHQETITAAGHSVDNLNSNNSNSNDINKSVSNRSFVTSGLQLSNVSSLSPPPLPDISGGKEVSHFPLNQCESVNYGIVCLNIGTWSSV